jgi:hypothetical protein
MVSPALAAANGRLDRGVLLRRSYREDVAGRGCQRRLRGYQWQAI